MKNISFVCLFLLCSCDEKQNSIRSAEIEEAKNELSLLSDKKMGANCEELSVVVKDNIYFWQNDAWLGNGLGQGGRIYHVVEYRSDIDKTEIQILIAKLKDFLKNTKAGSDEYAELGQIRFRDYAAIVLADLIKADFYIGMFDLIEEREKRILELTES